MTVNLFRRRLVLGGSAALALATSASSSASTGAPVIAFIAGPEIANGLGFEEMRLAIERRFQNERIRPRLVSIWLPSKRNDEIKQKLRDDLLTLRPEAIISSSDGYVDGLRSFKLGRPILFFYPGNPVVRGFTDSLVRPSNGATGYVLGNTSLIKRRETLFRLLPECKTLGIYDLEFEPPPVPYNDSIIENDPFTHVRKRFFYFSKPSDFEKFARSPLLRSVDAWDIPWCRFSWDYGELMAREFARARIPVMFPRLHFLKWGGTAAVQPNIDDCYAVFADQVAALLRGVPIEEIPIVQSSRYSIGLNLGALRRAGVNPSKALVKVADVVIQ